MTRIITLLMMLPIMSCLHAQQCNGSFGDPILTVDFGNNALTGANYSPTPLASGITTYDYINFAGVEDGQYTLAVNGNQGRPEWHNITDHTDDNAGQGYMLIVNADFPAGEFYRQTVDNLCENQVFEFSAWIINLLPAGFAGCAVDVLPNVKFRIEDTSGNILGETDSGDLNPTANPQWLRFSFDFAIPPGLSEIQVVLLNNGGGGCGNDLAIDDISFRPCSNLASVVPQYADFDQGVCKDDVIQLDVDIQNNPYLNPVYQWQESLDGGATWTNIAGATQPSLTVMGFIDGHQYRYTISEAANAGNVNCRVNSEPLIISYYLPPAFPPANLIGCNFNGNGITTFDLTEVIPEVLDGGSETDYFVTFHYTAAEAENGINAIINMVSFQNTISPQPIFVRVEDRNRGCYDTTDFELEVSELPVPNSPVTLYQCDEGDGITDFNLREANDLILTGNYTFTYYLNQTAAQTEDMAYVIVNDTFFSNAVATIVWANVKDPNGCYSVAEVLLEPINSNIPANFMITYEECDNLLDGDDTNGITRFDFSDATAQVEALFPGQDLTITYYESEFDALAEVNPIDPSAHWNVNSPGTELIYVRADDINNGCFGLGGHITLIVNPLPAFEVNPEQTICLDQVPMTLYVENPQGSYTYEWTNPSGTVISNLNFADVTQGGVYTVTATTTNGTNCEVSRTITLTESESAQVNDITVRDAVQNNTVTVSVSGIGDYEYSLGGITYQDSNIFENVPGGSYTLYVRDKNGCTTITQEICVVGIPVVFTPNGDNINDFWTIDGAGIDCYENAIITIFDRYGKLLKQIAPNGPGWDGTYNGKPMPSTDYWYAVELRGTVNRTVKGHFTLKR